jgi:hypothetical protein
MPSPVRSGHAEAAALWIRLIIEFIGTFLLVTVAAGLA